MDKKEHIQKLLEKYKEKNLTAREYQELNNIIRPRDENPELFDIVKNAWKESKDTSIDVPTQKMLEKIKSLSGFDTKDNNTRKNLLIPYLKYAAIIIISLGIGWLIRGTINPTKTYGFDSLECVSDNEITVSYGSKTKVKLPDGSVVDLNSGTLLRYPAQFDSVSRRVYIEGEAFFDVKKDSAHPFLVETKDITIRVLGTEFNVKAYNDEKIVQTVLVSGSVEIYSNKEQIKEKNRLLILEPNQEATYQREDESIALSDTKSTTQKSNLPISISEEVAVNTFIAWKDNMLVFRDEKFSDIAKKMERWYDVKIEIQDEDLANVLLSGVFEKESVEQALSALRVATPFRYQMKKNNIIISKLKI